VHMDMVLAQVLLGENQHLFDGCSKIGLDRLRGMVTSEPEHAVDDGGGALAAFQDLVKRLRPRGFVASASKPDLGVVDNGGEDVVEFVSNAGRQSTDRGESLGVKKLLPQLVGFAAGNHQVLASHGLLSSWR